MTRANEILVVFFLSMLALCAASLGSDIELTSKASYESTYRIYSGQFDVNRAMYTLGAKQAWEKPSLEAGGEVWAWSNLSAANYGLTQNEVALRKLTLSYWADAYGVTAGLQEISWGETFGYRPSDLVNARNHRDFSLLDHARNKIPIWAVKGYASAGIFKFQAIGNPRGETPILPVTLHGVPVLNDSAETRWAFRPEYGVKASALFEDFNVDLFAYRHLNRYPVFLLAPGPQGPSLAAQYMPVTSLGASFSRGLQDVVLRADAVATPDHPVSNATMTALTKRTVFSSTLGADWTPADLVGGLTVGVQGQVDRYPTSLGRTTYGGSVMARKSLLREKLELEGQIYQGVGLSDRWVQTSAKVRLGDVECRLLAEFIKADPQSPFALFDDTSRVGTQVSYIF